MIITRRSEQPRRRPMRVRSSGMGDVAALVIGAQTDLSPAELRARGMQGMGATWLENALGPKLNELQSKLGKVELLLKVAAGAALFSAGVALVALRRK